LQLENVTELTEMMHSVSTLKMNGKQQSFRPQVFSQDQQCQDQAWPAFETKTETDKWNIKQIHYTITVNLINLFRLCSLGADRQLVKFIKISIFVINLHKMHTFQQIIVRSRKQTRPILQDQDQKTPVSRPKLQSRGLYLCRSVASSSSSWLIIS